MLSEAERLSSEAERLRIQSAILELLSLARDVHPLGNGKPPALNAVDDEDEEDDSDKPPPVTRRVRVITRRAEES